ncbi:MAG: T9SS type A sorting domain-containing protein [Bacteroidetes bacterium]|nr:T9SS type A sorting domain-containing protein [Bacteroidota bacterium]
MKLSPERALFNFIAGAVFFLPMLSFGQSFGQYFFSHPSHILSSGKTTTLNGAGFLRAGYKSTSNAGTNNFVIEKTNANGFISSPGSFNRDYRILESNTLCVGSATNQVLNCSGISVIETSVITSTSAGVYALAGSYSKGVFFSLLDSLGTTIVSKVYLFPVSPNNTKQPFICESVSTPNSYYITGSTDTSMYVLKITGDGTLLWSSFYHSNYLSPRQILEDPYSSDLMIVGNTIVPVSYNKSTDGFILGLNKTNGTILNYKTYGNTGCQGFSSLAVSSCTTGGVGFILGGESDPFTTTGQAWFAKLNTNGNFIWSNIIDQAGVSGSFPVLDIEERFNGISYEYYGLVSNSSYGTVVFKLNESGQPFAGTNNAFIYNAGTNVSFPSNISFNNSGPSTGIQIYGTQNFSTGNFYFIKADFDGQSSCNQTLTTISQYEVGSTTISSPWIGQYGSLTSCDRFAIQSTAVLSTTNSACFVPVTAGGYEDEMDEIGIYPNPVNDKITIKSKDVIYKFEISNLLGQTVKVVDKPQSTEIDVGELSGGTYFLTLWGQNGPALFKIIKQ